MPSVVIPAHDEVEVIDRCLASIFNNTATRDLEVVVVCNGCTDDTAQVARGYGDRISVIETDVASKSHALNLGDEAVSSFPRMYLDADIELAPNGLDSIFSSLKGNTLAVSPKPNFDLSRSSVLVRMFYAAWTKLPYFNESMIGGSGAYALSLEGRSRFDSFPDLISDDGFVRLHFKADERAIIRETTSTVRCPHRMSDLLNMVTRTTIGRRQLRLEHPELDSKEETTPFQKIGVVLRSPHLFPCFVVYAATRLIAHHRVRRYRNNHTSRPDWFRDDSSRVRT